MEEKSKAKQRKGKQEGRRRRRDGDGKRKQIKDVEGDLKERNWRCRREMMLEET